VAVSVICSTAAPNFFETMQDLPYQASAFAQRAHLGQSYGDGDFHAIHLNRVVAVLHRYGETDPRLLAAAWLHDVIEDTPITLEDVRASFGVDVADLVNRLTDEQGGNRRERQEKTHLKIRGRAEAVRVKLADRIANVEYSVETNDGRHLGMYRKEHASFRDHLYQAGEYEEMWQRLEELLVSEHLRHV
jgi:(p)ppGpp synthase/HD superfamily hydrolase